MHGRNRRQSLNKKTRLAHKKLDLVSACEHGEVAMASFDFANSIYMTASSEDVAIDRKDFLRTDTPTAKSSADYISHLG